MGLMLCLSRPRLMRDMSSCWASPHSQKASLILQRRQEVHFDHLAHSLISRQPGAMLPLTICFPWPPYSKVMIGSRLPPNYFSCHLGLSEELFKLEASQTRQIRVRVNPLVLCSTPIQLPCGLGRIQRMGCCWIDSKSFSHTQSQGILE